MLLLHAPHGPARSWMLGLQPRLTPREREMRFDFARGMSYARREEAREIKPVTARNAIYGIQQRLKVGTMQGLVRNGLPGD